MGGRLTGTANEVEGTARLQNKYSTLQSELEKVQYSAHFYLILSGSIDPSSIPKSLGKLDYS